MQTLTLTETGRESNSVVRPWPWAINHGGQGHWFNTQAEMLDYAETLISAGESSFDIGCFQLNYRWHGHQFPSLRDMADPVRNADYAASFLRSKFDAAGSWREAVGAYHSETDATAAAYIKRFEAAFAEWQATLPIRSPVVSPESEPTNVPSNNFPLLITGDPVHGASLVPMTDRGIRLIGQIE
jgi:hypothetical protein